MKNIKKSLSEKLYITRDIEGQPNTEVLRIIRSLEDELKKKPEFIGIAPVGSTMKGYATEKSDIDVQILFDAPQELENKVTTELEQIAEPIRARILKETARELQPGFINVNPETILFYLQQTYARNFAFMKLRAIFLKVTGDKINHYRERIVQEINKLAPNEKSALIQEVINYIVERDQESETKIQQRFPQTRQTIDEIRTARRKLWEKRIQDFFNPQS